MKLKETNKNNTDFPISLLVGEEEDADYKEQRIPEYVGNPLIEALPKLLTIEEVKNKLAHFPEFYEEQRSFAPEERLHLLDNAREFFVPQSRHIELHYAVSNMIRRSYINRNPLERGFWNDFNDRLENLSQKMKKNSSRSRLRTKARGFAIVGGGGNGKTSSVENDLSLYPQVIKHSNYKGSNFILKQLVWLKIDCPRDGSIKALCIAFFQSVDEVLGTNYLENYGNKTNTIDQMLLDMARVAAMHCLGVLAIDEIQDLSEAKSGGAAHLLNFFVHLENCIGVPYILVGTSKALPLFSGEFRQARRASEQGDFHWERMKLKSEESKESEESEGDEEQPDAAWKEFIEILWEYQYLKQPAKLASNILNDPSVMTLYNLSQGIPAIALTLFVLAQNRAILSQKETLTPAIFNSAERDRLNLIRHGIDQIRLGREISYRDISDIDSTFWMGRKRAGKSLNLKGENKGHKNESDNKLDDSELDRDSENSDSKVVDQEDRSGTQAKDHNLIRRDKKSDTKNNDFLEVQQSIKNAAEFIDL